MEVTADRYLVMLLLHLNLRTSVESHILNMWSTNKILSDEIFCNNYALIFLSKNFFFLKPHLKCSDPIHSDKFFSSVGRDLAEVSY